MIRPSTRTSLGALAALALVLSACQTATTDAGSAASSGTAIEAGNGTTVGISPDVVEAVADQPMSGAVGSGLTRGVTDDSIKVGCVALNAYFPNAASAYQARFDRANAEGGVNGRMIDFSGCEDDGQSADTNLAVTRRLVEQDQDFAVMQFSTYATPQVTDYLNENQVPYFGWGFVPGFCGTRWGFGFNGCLVSTGVTDLQHGWSGGSNTYPLLASGLSYADSKVALLGTDNDASRSANADFATVVDSQGGEVVYNESVVPLTGVTDYTSYVRPVIAAQPNAVLVNVGLADLGKVIAAFRAGGYQGLITNPSGYQPGLLETQPALAAALEGTWSVSSTTPIEVDSPFNHQMLADFTADGVTTGQATIFAYVQADEFLQMLDAAGPTLDTGTFDTAVNGGDFTYQPTDGGPAALPFPAGHFAAADCSAAVQVVNGAYDVKGAYTCFDSISNRG